jgi:SAM-dependent methyltransferase
MTFMLKIVKNIVAIFIWWACYIPLNALIIVIFIKHALSGKKAIKVEQQSYENDDQRIRALVERNLEGCDPDKDDEGFGTRFERQMMAELLKELVQRHRITSVLESPADGVTGVPGANSLPLAAVVQKPVLLANPSELLLQQAQKTWEKKGLLSRAKFLKNSITNLPLQTGEYDLVWSFCMMERLNDPIPYLKESARVSGKVVLMVTLNYNNHGTWLHRVYHRIKGMEWDHGNFAMMGHKGIIDALYDAGLTVLEKGAVDVPPSWDTWDMPLGSDIGKITAIFGKKWEWKMAAVDQKPGLLLNIFGWVENNLPGWFKTQQAHHLYVIAKPQAL